MLPLIVLPSLLFAACSSKPVPEKPAPKLPTSIEEAVAHPLRSENMRARDTFRHPVATLEFFGLKNDMTVVEISPGGGWYTQILAPFLAEKGQYIAAAVPSEAGDYMKNLNEQRNAWLATWPEVASKVKETSFMPPQQMEIAPEGSADLVLTFRNVHNWMSSGSEQAAFKSFFKALKPGGTLGVVEHRAPTRQKFDPKAKSGYVREQDVIRLAQRAGFKLVEKSEINANPKDTKDHPEGVWTLPPSLRLKDKDREKYLAIGESDRMTLKFVKPVSK
ncbi:MAG: class I SAM-dependent methyltransferase [Bdellovibrionaceae bacterium]|nr:class I SAM-dependent methyltransferase [Pseudobdellovibrionaceae bacterium]